MLRVISESVCIVLESAGIIYGSVCLLHKLLVFWLESAWVVLESVGIGLGSDIFFRKCLYC